MGKRSAKNAGTERYKVPESFASMTIHYLIGISEPGNHDSVLDYLTNNHFALTADLLYEGFSAADIEEEVNSGRLGAAHWPEKKPVTDFYWSKDEESLRRLDELAGEAVRFCYGKAADEPVGGNFASVGAEMGSQQIALAGLVYAREKGLLREIPGLESGAGPLYVAKGSFSDQMFSKLFPDDARR